MKPLLMSLLLLLTSCQTDQRGDLVVVAHRGGAMEVPENTMAACRWAIAEGFEAVEIDVRLTGDGRAAMIHDRTVDRTAGRPASAPVRQLDLQTLNRFDVGAPFDRRFEGERIVPLETVLQLPWGERTRLMIEVKREGDHKATESVPDDRALADAVARAIGQAPNRSGLLLGSFSATLLGELRTRLPDVPLIGIASTREDLAPHLKLPLTAVALNRKHVTRSFTEDMSRRGLGVWCWTVRDPSELAPLLEADVDGVITDIPTMVRKLLRGQTGE